MSARDGYVLAVDRWIGELIQVRVLRRSLVLAVLLHGAVIAAPVPEDVRARVIAAAQRTWFHGMTDEIARREAGPEGIPVLIELLRDPAFPRRDNVVAMLAHLGGPETRAGPT